MSQIVIPIPSSSVIGVSSTPINTPSVNILRVEPSITTLTGGSGSLAGLSTIDGVYSVGIVIFLVISNAPAIYQLTEGEDAENDPFIIRPNDYGVQAGNKRVWKRLM
jgi:hypothetical protein